jgi:CRISPR/Cas system-associated endoribonuclease Cas2
MAVYIVTYDLNKPGKNYDPLLTAIRKYTHCHALKSAFFIDTSQEASTIRDNLIQFIDANDSLYVMELRKHWAANREMACTTWLKDSARTWS